MADQATVNGNGGAKVKVNSPLVEGVLGNMAEFSTDLISLAELQARLAAADLKESTGRAVVPAGLLVGGTLLALVSLPVLLFGVGYLLAEYTSLSVGWSILLTAVAALLLGAVLAILGLRGLGGSFTSFQRSKEELTRNLAWVKTVLVHSGRPPQRNRRF
jgi:hypothetical protein